MGTQRRGHINVMGTVEHADQLTDLIDRLFNRQSIGRRGAAIAVAQLVGRKQRLATGQIKHKITGRSRPLTDRTELIGLTRGRQGQREIIDAQGKSPEMTTRQPHFALHHRKRCQARRHNRTSR